MSRTPRIHTAERLAEGREVTLDDEAAHHITRVLRLGPGDALILFDGHGGEYAARITHAHKSATRAMPESYRNVDNESPLRITLLQGISKGNRMEYTLQKAVELGVHAVVPVHTARSMGKAGNQPQKRMQRWNRILRSAAEQSGRTRIPVLDEPREFQEILELPENVNGLVLTPEAKNGLERPDSPPRNVHLLIGPEGGLNDQEVRHALGAGYQGVRFGPRVLRTETAGVAALAVLQGLWGDLATGYCTD